MDRNVKKTITLVILIMLTSAFANAKHHIYREQPRVIEIKKATVTLQTVEISPTEHLEITVPKRELDHFLHDMGMRESSNRHYIVNRWGYSGLYQFSKKNIRKFAGVSQAEFLLRPEIQKRAMIKLMKHNKKVLRKQIAKYDGKTVHGVYVTESGLIAAAHLAGAGNVRRWLRNGRNPSDKLGTRLTDYLVKFNGYDLQI